MAIRYRLPTPSVQRLLALSFRAKIVMFGNTITVKDELII